MVDCSKLQVQRKPWSGHCDGQPEPQEIAICRSCASHDLCTLLNLQSPTALVGLLNGWLLSTCQSNKSQQLCNERRETGLIQLTTPSTANCICTFNSHWDLNCWRYNNWRKKEFRWKWRWFQNQIKVFMECVSIDVL